MISWERTWPDNPARPKDFSAVADGARIGRVYRVHMAVGYAWSWSAHGITASSGTVGCALSGHEATKQEAADRVKAAWARWVEMGKTAGPGP